MFAPFIRQLSNWLYKTGSSRVCARGACHSFVREKVRNLIYFHLWQCHLFVQFVLCCRVGQLFLYFMSSRVIPQQPLEFEELLVLTFYWWGRVRLREVKWLGQDLLIALSLQENSFFLEIIIFLVFSPLHPSWCDFVFPHSSIMYFNQGVI